MALFHQSDATKYFRVNCILVPQCVKDSSKRGNLFKHPISCFVPLSIAESIAVGNCELVEHRNSSHQVQHHVFSTSNVLILNLIFLISITARNIRSLIKRQTVKAARKTIVGCRLCQWVKQCGLLPATSVRIYFRVDKNNATAVEAPNSINTVVFQQKLCHRLIVDLIELEISYKVNRAIVCQRVVEILCSFSRHIETDNAKIFAVVFNTKHIATADVGSRWHCASYPRIGLNPESWTSSGSSINNFKSTLLAALCFTCVVQCIRRILWHHKCNLSFNAAVASNPVVVGIAAASNWLGFDPERVRTCEIQIEHIGVATLQGQCGIDYTINGVVK